jgi:hypothetical protein
MTSQRRDQAHASVVQVLMPPPLIVMDVQSSG